MSEETGEGTRGAPGSLRARAATGTAWTAGGFLLRQAIRLGANLVLARLLFPEAFGLMAIVNVFLIGVHMFSDLGLSLNVIQSPRGDDPRFLDTAYSVQILRGLALFGLVCAFAWPVAAFYELPELRAMLPVAGLALLVQGFFSTGVYRLQRHMSLARFEAIELAGQVAPALAMVAWAWVSPTVWALVIGGVAGQLARVALGFWLVPEHRARPAWDRSALSELIGFGKWVFLSTLLTFLADQTDRLVLGKLIALDLLGAYSIAAMFAHLPVQLMTKLGALVAFPAFSRSMERGDDFAAVFQRTRRALLAMGGLVVVCMGASAQPLIATLYDARYAEAGWMLGLLAIRAWFNVVQVPHQSALLAHGAPRFMALSNGVKLAALVAFLAAGYRLGGLQGLIVALVCADVVRYGVAVWATRQFQLRGLRGDLLATAALAAAGALGLGAARLVADAGSPAWMQLLAALGASGLSWGLMAALLLRGEWRDVLGR